MAKLKLFLLCDDIRKRTDGRYDVIGLTNAIVATTFPIEVPVVFFMVWENAIEDIRGTVRFTQPGREKPVDISFSQPAGNNPFLPLDIHFTVTIKFLGQGLHFFQVLHDDQVAGDYSLFVDLKKQH